MQIQKVSVSLPKNLYDFIEDFREDRHCSRSEVIALAVKLLQESRLEAAYKQANQEIDADLDNLASDGVEDDETW